MASLWEKMLMAVEWVCTFLYIFHICRDTIPDNTCNCLQIVMKKEDVRGGGLLHQTKSK